MVNFRFIITATIGTPDEDSAILRDIDNELIECLGNEPDPNRWSQEYEFLTTLGIIVCARSRDLRGYATPEAYDETIERYPMLSPKEKAVYKGFLCGKYTFWTFRMQSDGHQ